MKAGEFLALVGAVRSEVPILVLVDGRPVASSAIATKVYGHGLAIVVVTEADALRVAGTGELGRRPKAGTAPRLYRAHAPDACDCTDCECPCHRDVHGIGGLDGDQARHHETKCSCHRCSCACHE